ncbi:uncharacterized protein LOC143225026 [Tachypleus tridentatus]|uniref:uncharacterized protein LOC143225026 n=1 Tax=Tachypleus tridentatus TaxID=6853 RepID=UPI003FD5ABC8
MPRGRGGKTHKGKTRCFTNPEELEAKEKKTEREKQWREQKGELSSSDSDGATGKKEVSSSESGESSSEEEETKGKGVEHLIDVENPNRVVKKKPLKADYHNIEVIELSRREREEIEHQKAKANYMKLHAAGKTQEAQADLARLTMIRKQREEAAKKREEAKKAKESIKAGKSGVLEKKS